MAYIVEFVLCLGLGTTPHAFKQVIFFCPSIFCFIDWYVVFGFGPTIGFCVGLVFFIDNGKCPIIFGGKFKGSLS